MPLMLVNGINIGRAKSRQDSQDRGNGLFQRGQSGIEQFSYRCAETLHGYEDGDSNTCGNQTVFNRCRSRFVL